jgi:LPS-assembly lipoprotein
MKHILMSIALLALGACGFEPMHGRAYQQRTIEGELAAVMVDTPTGILGELLRAEIEDAVNPEYQNAPPRYRLKIDLLEQEIPLFVNIDGTANRGEMRYTSSYVLTRLSDNSIIHQGTVRRVGSYNSAQTADYAAYVSKEDAKKRAVIELAQDYKLRLANLSAKLAP